MSYNGIRVSFACRLCTNSFEQIIDFIHHKKENHFHEFQQTTCIIFEEKLYPNLVSSDDNHVQSSLTSSVLVKYEAPEEDTTLVYKPELLNYDESDKKCIFSKEPNFQVIPHKIKTKKEKTIFEHRIQPQWKNPAVLIKRISCKNAQNFTVDNSNQESDEESSYTTDNFREAPVTETSISDATYSLKCRLCDKSFSSDPQLRIHIQICLLYNNNNANLVYCAKCNNFFSNSQELQHHIKFCHVQQQKVITEKPQPPPTTPVFNTFEKKTGKNSNLLHVNCLEQNPKEVRESFSVDIQRAIHWKTDNLSLSETIKPNFNSSHSKSYKCSFSNCKSEFKNKLSLQRHFEHHAGGFSKSFKCSFSHCKSAFNEKEALEKHTSRSHTREKPLKCPFPHCQSSFWCQEYLEAHVRRHTGSKPFKCQQPNCGKAFANLGTLYNHKTTHSDSFPFKCPYASCPKAYKGKRDANRHFKAVHI